MNAVIWVGRAIQNALEPEGMNLITSSGALAEQSVFHLHLHLVPRWSNDGFGRIWPPESKSLTESAKEYLADRIHLAWQGLTSGAESEDFRRGYPN
jgi:histidine triad (HIT) family protein